MRFFKKQTTPKSENPWQKATRIVLNVLLVLALGLAILAAVYAKSFKQADTFVFGYKPFVVSSDSMAPKYRKYSLVLVKKDAFKTVEVGELIAFKAQALGGQPAFHRVRQITDAGILTKGDANKQADTQLINADSYLGSEVWHTNLTADLVPVLKTPRGIFFLVVSPLVLVFLIVMAIKILKVNVRKKDTVKSQKGGSYEIQT